MRAEHAYYARPAGSACTCSWCGDECPSPNEVVRDAVSRGRTLKSDVLVASVCESCAAELVEEFSSREEFRQAAAEHEAEARRFDRKGLRYSGLAEYHERRAEYLREEGGSK